MYKIWISTFLSLLALNVHAQLGISISGDVITHEIWADRTPNIDPLEEARFTEIGVAIDYRKCLRKGRLEFYPGLRLVQANTQKINSKASNTKFSVQYRSMSISTAIHAYFLDWSGNCGTATYDRHDNWLTKGLFIHTGIEGGLRFIEANALESLIRKSETEALVRFIAGLGLDIGISDLITLTPMTTFGYNRTANLFDQVGSTPTAWSYGVAIRLGIELSR